MLKRCLTSFVRWCHDRRRGVSSRAAAVVEEVEAAGVEAEAEEGAAVVVVEAEEGAAGPATGSW